MTDPKWATEGRKVLECPPSSPEEYTAVHVPAIAHLYAHVEELRELLDQCTGGTCYCDEDKDERCSWCVSQSLLNRDAPPEVNDEKS